VTAKKPSDLMTRTEVAEAFRVKPLTVTRWAKAGKLTFVWTLGGHRRFKRAEVLALLAFETNDSSVAS